LGAPYLKTRRRFSRMKTTESIEQEYVQQSSVVGYILRLKETPKNNWKRPFKSFKTFVKKPSI